MIRENWRLVLLVVFVIAAGVALFAPPLGGGGANATAAAPTADGPTNLQYGLELSGGTRIRAPLVGLTAEGVDVERGSQANVTREVASALNVSGADVQVRVGNGSATVEVFPDRVTSDEFAGAPGNVSQEEFTRALQSAGLDVSRGDVSEGVTDQTYETAVNTLDNKVSESGLAGGSVQTVQSAGEQYIQIEVPNQNRSEVQDLVADQGRVTTVAYFPVEGNETPAYCEPGSWDNASSNGTVPEGYCSVTVLDSQEGFQDIQPVQQESGEPFVPVTLTEEADGPFAQSMQDYGFADRANASTCRFDESRTGHCLLTVVDGRVVYSAGVEGDLAASFATDDFENRPAYRTFAPNISTAQELQVNLQAGALPARLDIDAGTSQFILPDLAEKFKRFSLITGLIAVLAVAVTVFIRYRDPRVAIPMVLTALAEVFILLGFASAVGLALDLSYIAGFVAVIGTGVDDLVIIADEILQSDVKTGRVFKSRFRRALWVIGAAAATTIIAMSPLAILSLGDLRGFAIITIVGVLIGVLVTRPAYGNILRNLVTED
ncbi:preprotein translocase subunit SecD [Halococcus saccharolyticus]|uniref:Protein-export membrane protein SecD n=1 Tax=Halococcus saccharolyticus DSM 5350 TaxID=1227455 RepID=M0MEN5_9EURY|nr:preprotein translocase subunit SecD [Halococcus saccharolyticus]EMA43124.1 preprotein translocase subunit SecD [Halococcus saccharolyticus DSM 5350]